MMQMAETSRLKNGNSFTYTLIDKKEIIKKRINLAAVGAILIGLTGYIYYLRKRKVI
jgi:LPXTG-motif cell wall-anchored protein